MAATLGSKILVQQGDAEASLRPSVKRKAMSRPRKRISCGQGRDFFRLAASFANADEREADFSEKTKAAPKDVLAELAASKFLQAHYQERSPLFALKISPSSKLSLVSGRDILEKWQRAGGVVDRAIETVFLSTHDCETAAAQEIVKEGFVRNGVSFSAREIAFLVAIAEKTVINEYVANTKVSPPNKLSATDFHRRFSKCLAQKSPSAFICEASSAQPAKKMHVERARLFWSHRLQTKAWQANNAAEAAICYFHAALRSDNMPYAFDFVYWLRLDQEKVALDGGFIHLETTNETPANLILPKDLLIDAEHRKACLASANAPTKLFVEEVMGFCTHWSAA